MRFILPLALTLCTLPLAAQDAPPPQHNAAPAPPPQTGSIHGTVFCADTRKPARGAFVMIQEIPSADGQYPRNNQPGMARTGMDGTYTIPHVAEGSYGVVAVLPGYLSALNDLTEADLDGVDANAVMAKKFAEGGAVTVSARQTSTHDITLQRGASFSGRVLFSDGSPATQVNIDLQDINAKPSVPKPGEPQFDIASLMQTMFTHQTNATDDQGNFRLSGVSPGTYRLAAVTAVSIDPNEMNDVMAMLSSMLADPSSLHIYAGDTLHKNAARTFEVRPSDDVTGIDIVIPLNIFHHLSGSLVAKDGRPINQATLTLTDITDDSFHFTANINENTNENDDDGTFSFPTVPAGTYKLTVTNARITGPLPNIPPQLVGRYLHDRVAVAAFADTSTTVLVKESDIADLTVPLPEIPLPPANNPDSTADGPITPR